MRFGSTVCKAILVLAALLFGTQCQKTDSNAANVKATATAFKQAILTHDVKGLESLITANVTDYDLTRQETVTGRDNVATYLSQLLPTEQVPKVSVSIESIKARKSDMIRAKGVIDIDFEAAPHEQIAFSIDFAKEDGAWKIAQINHLLLEPAPSHYEQLKNLSWLIGSWANQDEDTDFTSHYEWDMNKNFLLQNFSLTILGHKELSGTQRIGWDPVQNSIRSWIFDTDGGFGESTWAQDEDSKDNLTWYVTTSFTLSDGRKSSATQIFKKIDDATYTFSSVGRDVDGRMLPNIGPFTIVKDAKGGAP